MNTHNGEDFLKEALESVLVQTYENFEIIFWDNCSDDNTQKIVNSYHDKRIKYFYSDEFTPLGEARNRAIDKSNGDLIAFLDCDDVWMSNKLELQVPVFDNKDIGIVISDTIFFDKKRNRRQLFKKNKPPIGSVFRSLITDYFISLETAMIRKSALNSLDYWFDTHFEVIEEYDLFIRLSFFWELGYVDQVLGKWRIHDTSWTWSKSHLFSLERKIFFENLKKTIPNFTENYYKEEFRVIQRSIDWDDARELWKFGKKDKARVLLKKYKYDSFKWKAVHILTWFPYTVFKILASLLGRVAP
jgi:glycosyltransferase involved in cell wall biosynthesis